MGIVPNLPKFSNVEIEKDNSTYVCFKTTCECGDSGHIITIQLDYDSEIMECLLYMNCDVGDYEVQDRKFHFLNKLEKYLSKDTVSDICYTLRRWVYKYDCLVWRLKKSWKLFSTGRIESQGCFIFRDATHMEEFAHALLKGKEYIHYNKPLVEHLKEAVKELQRQLDDIRGNKA